MSTDIREVGLHSASASRPAGATPTSQESEGRVVYTVQRGDTLLGIMRRFDLRDGQTVRTVARQSNISNPNLIRPGQKIILYTKTEKAPATCVVLPPASDMLLASVAPVLARTAITVTLPAPLTPSSPQQTVKDFAEEKTREGNKKRSTLWSKPYDLRIPWFPKGKAGAPVAQACLWYNAPLNPDLASQVFEDLAISWLAQSAIGASGSRELTSLLSLSVSPVLVNVRGTEHPARCPRTYQPVRYASPYWLVKMGFVLSSRLGPKTDTRQVQAGLLAEMKRRRPNLAPLIDPLLTKLNGDRPIIKEELYKIYEVMLNFYQSTGEDIQLEFLLLGELKFNLAINAPDQATKDRWLDQAERDFQAFIDEGSASEVKEQIAQRISYRKGGWKPDDPLVDSEYAFMRGNALRLIAQIRVLQAGDKPGEKIALLSEAFNLLQEAQKTLTGIFLLASRKMMAEILLQMAGEGIEEAANIAEGLPVLKDYLTQLGIDPATDPTQALDVVITWGKLLMEHVEEWGKEYESQFSPAKKDSWLATILDLSFLRTELATLEQKDLDPAILAQLKGNLAGLSDPARLIEEGGKIATYYLKLKGLGRENTAARELAQAYFRKAAESDGEITKVKANFWLAKLETADAGEDLTRLEAAAAGLRSAIDLELLSGFEYYEAHKVLGENLTRQALIIQKTDRKRGLEVLREAEAALEIAIAAPQEPQNLYTIAAAKVWLAKVLAAQTPNSPPPRAFTLINEALDSGRLKGRELAESRKTLGDLHVTAGSFSAAESAYLRALTSDPQNHWARLSLAKVYTWTAKYEEAIQQYGLILAATDLPTQIRISAQLGRLETICRRDEDYSLLDAKESREILVAAFKSKNPELIRQAVALVLEAHLADPSTQKEIIPLVNFLLGLSGEEKLTELGGLTTPLSQLVQLYVDPSGLYDQESAAALYLQAAETYIGQRKFELAEAALAKARPGNDAPVAERVNYDLAVATLALRRTPGKAGAEQAGDTAEAVLNGTAPTWLKAKAFLLKLEALANKEAYQQIIELTGAPPLALTPKQQLQADFYKVDALMATKKYQDALILACGIATSTKATVQQQAEALYRMGEINRYGLDKPAEAKQNYDEALALAEGLDQLSAEIRLGQLKLLEEEGKKGEMRRTYPKVDRAALPLEKQQELRAVGAKLTEPLVSVSERGAILPDRTEYREEVAVKVPVVDLPGEAGRLSVTTRILHDRAAGTRQTDALLGVAIDDARIDAGSAGPIIASGALEVGTGPIVHQHTPGRSTRFFKQPDLTLRAGLWNQYFSVDGSMEAQIYPGRDPRVQSGYAAALHNFAWTGLPFIKDLSLGLDYGYSNFFYNNDERSRHSLALAFRMKFDPLETFGLDRYAGVLTLFGRARWMPGGPFSEYLPQAELAGATSQEARAKYSGKMGRPHGDWRRGSVGGGLTLDFSPLGVPISLSGEANYYNTFSHQQGGQEYNTRFWDWRGTVNLDLSEPIEALVDWIKRQ